MGSEKNHENTSGMTMQCSVLGGVELAMSLIYAAFLVEQQISDPLAWERFVTWGTSEYEAGSDAGKCFGELLDQSPLSDDDDARQRQLIAIEHELCNLAAALSGPVAQLRVAVDLSDVLGGAVAQMMREMRAKMAAEPPAEAASDPVADKVQEQHS
jgi:hypothetical protein